MYGANGFVGREIARLAVRSGLNPVIAGRDAAAIADLASELGVESRVFSSEATSGGLADVSVMLNCAGPYIHTYRPIVDACLERRVHYLDITGEIPVYEAIAAMDATAKERGVMLLPGVGFDVVPTDCLAAHLAKRLPTATRLTLAFHVDGPAGLPPGTQRTMIELMPYGNRVRRDGHLVAAKPVVETRTIDLGGGPVVATRITWGDIFTAFMSTGIPNIEDYVVLPLSMHKQMRMLDRIRPLFRLRFVREWMKRKVKPGSTPDQRARTKTHVWGEVEDASGRRASARLHGPEAAVTWTACTAIAAARRALSGSVHPGYQTPATAYGADFVFDCEGVTREDA